MKFYYQKNLCDYLNINHNKPYFKSYIINKINEINNVNTDGYTLLPEKFKDLIKCSLNRNYLINLEYLWP